MLRGSSGRLTARSLRSRRELGIGAGTLGNGVRKDRVERNEAEGPQAAIRQPQIAMLEPAPPPPGDRAPRQPHPPGNLSPGRPSAILQWPARASGPPTPPPGPDPLQRHRGLHPICWPGDFSLLGFALSDRHTTAGLAQTGVNMAGMIFWTLYAAIFIRNHRTLAGEPSLTNLVWWRISPTILKI